MIQLKPMRLYRSDIQSRIDLGLTDISTMIDAVGALAGQKERFVRLGRKTEDELSEHIRNDSP